MPVLIILVSLTLADHGFWSIAWGTAASATGAPPDVFEPFCPYSAEKRPVVEPSKAAPADGTAAYVAPPPSKMGGPPTTYAAPMNAATATSANA